VVKLNTLKNKSLIGLVLAILFANFALPVFANDQSTQSTIKLNATFTNSGEVAAGQQAIAASFQTAFKYIQEGTYPAEVVNSVQWNDSSFEGKIQVSGITLGVGVKNSAEDALSVVRELIRTDFTLLQVINESNNVAFGTSVHAEGNIQIPKNMVWFHSPSSQATRQADDKGNAQAEIEPGLVGIFLPDRTLLELTNIDESTGQLAVDTNIAHGLSVSILNLEKYQTDQDRYTVDYGQTISFHLTIQKNLLDPKNPTTITLRPNSNLVIDSTSLPNTRQDLIEELLISPVAFDPQAGASRLNDVATRIGSGFVTSSIYTNTIEIPPSDHDVDITIQAHLAPQVRIHREVADQSDPYNKVALDIPINAFSHPDVNFGISINLMNNQRNLTILTPSVNTSGINFVMADAKTNTLAKGATYVLGRQDNGKILLYSKQNTWEQVADLATIDKNNFLVLEGGKRYIISMDTPDDIDLATSRFNFDREENIKINQSLIQIYGLGNRSDYFLYQVIPADGFEPMKEPTNFAVTRTYGFSGNVSPITRTSVNNAMNQSFHLNALIPDHVSGVREYNILPVTPTKAVSFSSTRSIFIPLIIIVGVIFIISFILVKVV
jgi:hypothetical protein